MTEDPQCFDCKNLDKAKLPKLTCPAYPEGIPREILVNNVDHKKPYKGDNGIQYEESDSLKNFKKES